ncbi:MAG: S41 family peptidase [Anaerolineales bacterium]|nr:S41 family peptidase [Anaerolineales bacterium]
MKPIQIKYLLPISITILIIGLLAGYAIGSNFSLGRTTWPVLSQAFRILENHALKDLPADPAIEYGLIRGMLQAYGDPHTSFIEPILHELNTDQIEGSFGGIGVRMDFDQDGQLLLYPILDSPASRAGIQEADILTQIDGQNIAGKSMQEIQALLRGSVGSKVNVTILTRAAGTEKQFSIRREEIPLPSVTWHIAPDEPRLGVLDINIIAASTPAEIEKAAEDLLSRGAEGLVLDLRDNSGGLLTAGIDSARLFLAEGAILEQRYRNSDVESYRVEKPGPFTEIPLAILINHNTASAAEIIAGVLQVHGRAQVIGSPTFGKDTIQLVFDLQDGSSLHVTAAEWWIPGLEPPIHGHGIQPDYPVEPETSERVSSPELQAVIRLLFGNDGEK